MKKTILKFAILMMFFSSKAQNWVWAKSPFSPIETNITDEGVATCIDPSGNMYATGWFMSASLAFNTATLTSQGACMFLVKYDPNGNELWVKKACGGSFDGGWSVTTDAMGNVIVSGYFSSPTIAIGSTTLTNSNPLSNDIFLVKYDSNGNVIWARSAGGNNIDQAVSVKTDLNGNIFMSGYFASSTMTIGSYSLINSGGFDIFLAKYSPNGTVLWAKREGGTNDDYSFSTCTDALGNAFITGYFVSLPITFGATTFTAHGFLLVKYDTNGNVVWAKSSGGLNRVQGNSVSTDALGNIFIIGSFQCDTLAIGSTILINANAPAVPGNATHDIFIAKYNPNGAFVTAFRLGGSGADVGGSISTYSNGFYITGGFSSSSLIIGTYSLSPPFNAWDNMFIAKYDYNNNVLCASALASGGDDLLGLGVDQVGNAYITGDFVPTPFIIGSNTLTQNDGFNSENIFFAKYSCEVTGINFQSKNTNQTLIYPNPNKGDFTIQIDNIIKNGLLIIINVLGQKVYEQKIIHGANEIKTEGLPLGLYNYTLFLDGQTSGKGKLAIE